MSMKIKAWIDDQPITTCKKPDKKKLKKLFEFLEEKL